MKKILLFFAILTLSNIAFSQSIEVFYSRQSGGWENLATWSFSFDGSVPATGFPGPEDHVVILHDVTHYGLSSYQHNGDIWIRHNGTTNPSSLTLNRPLIFNGRALTIDALSSLNITANGFDNGFVILPGILGDAEVRSYGLININNQGGLHSIVNNGVFSNLGTTNTSGNFVNSKELVMYYTSNINVGQFPNPTVTNVPDFIATPDSYTQVNDSIKIADDLIVRGGDPTLVCGDPNIGRIVIGMNSPDSEMQFLDGATFENQICEEFQNNIYRFGDPNPLPITIISFIANKDAIEWDVIEQRISGFEIEFSADIQTWLKIGAIDGKGDGRHHYSFSVNKTGYYRLKVLSLEEPEYSSIVYYDGKEEIAFYPSSITSGEVVTFSGHKLINTVLLYNTKGNLVYKGLVKEGILKMAHTPGVYIVQIEGVKTLKTGRLIIN